MGRRKIEIKPIRDDRNRSVTFLKRKGGLFKKAHELSVLCSVDVAVVIFGHNKKLYEYSSSDINEIVGRFQYYGGAHEHKGPQDFADKGGGDDDEDEDGDGEGDERGTPQPEQTMMGMQHHPGFQHVRHGTPQGSPPMHNGAMPQFQRGPSPMPQGISRPSSRQEQHQGHIRRTSSNLVPPQHQQHPQGPMPQPNYAYTPNPPFYNPQAAAQMQRPPGQPGPPGPQHATYPPPYPPQGPQHQQMQQMIHDSRRASMPPGYPPQQQQPPQPNMQRHPSQEHLQPPPQHQHPQRQPSPQPQQQQHQQRSRPTPSPQPPQQQFMSPPIPQPKPLPAHQKSHSIFTPIDDSRSMLAAAWGSSNAPEQPRSDPLIKTEPGGPRSQSIDIAAMQREKEAAVARANGASPRPSPRRQPPPNRSPQQPIQRTESTPAIPRIRAPNRSNTIQSDAKRPRLKVQIPSEQSGDEGEDSSSQPATGQQHQQHPPSHGVVLPPPSPSAGALLSAGAQGPPNPFARPAPPMSTNPHAANREAAANIETPISALPSRFMSDNLLPSPSTFYPEWGFGRSADSNMLPSPLNFQTPVVGNGMQPWNNTSRDDMERNKRANEDDGGGGEGSKRQKT
ncbi:resistance to lethality of mkk1p386 overexpression [Vermiconidia calcicola]|uniref:Resistance to lethality of mkk1p386 overexpression n=1 Tax=Vermiconidia calcicola TaxID=1690605 RepID=A0ACC3N1Y1_9PEZI|nr:resistance to lethality of mkk1p386 overexpression [Vermiconidia calcicola]